MTREKIKNANGNKEKEKFAMQINVGFFLQERDKQMSGERRLRNMSAFGFRYIKKNHNQNHSL